MKKIPLGNAEISIIREHAQALRDGTLKSRGEALLPIMLASFIFDVLVSPNNSNGVYFILLPQFVLCHAVCNYFDLQCVTSKAKSCQIPLSGGQVMNLSALRLL